MDAKTRAAARRLRRKGHSLRAIAERLNVSHVAVLNATKDIIPNIVLTTKGGKQPVVTPAQKGARRLTHERNVRAAVEGTSPGTVASWALDDADAQGAETVLRHALTRLEGTGRITRQQSVRVIAELLGLGGDDGWLDDDGPLDVGGHEGWGCIPPDDHQ